MLLCWEAAPTQLQPGRAWWQLFPFSSEPSCNPRISAARMAEDHHQEDLSYLVCQLGSHREHPAVATRPVLPYAKEGSEEKQSPRSQPSCRNSDHLHRQRKRFCSPPVHSITGLSPRNIPCYFITRPQAEVILTQSFPPSNTRFHSCF